MDTADDLESGDFLYQSDQELFLCVIENREDDILFAAHGWRNIDKERVKEYVQDRRSKVHTQDEIEALVEEKGDEETKNQFDRLKQLFTVYEDVEIPSNGPQSDFALDE